MVELRFECFEYYPYIQMWQYMLLCGDGAKPVAHLMQYHLLPWEVARYDFNSAHSTSKDTQRCNHQDSSKKIQERYKRDKIASDMQDQRSNPGHSMTLHTYNPQPMSLPNINFPHYMFSEI